jgi:hypothetical protein
MTWLFVNMASFFFARGVLWKSSFLGQPQTLRGET